MDSTSMRNRASVEHAPSSLLAIPAYQAFPVIATEACASNGMRRITHGPTYHVDARNSSKVPLLNTTTAEKH